MIALSDRRPKLPTGPKDEPCWSWGLVYPSGLIVTERDTRDPFWSLPAGAHHLAVLNPMGTEVMRIGLTRAPDTHPVFYRIQACPFPAALQAYRKEVLPLSPLPTVFATVFGCLRIRRREDGEEVFDHALTAVIGGQPQPCAETYVDQRELARCAFHTDAIERRASWLTRN